MSNSRPSPEEICRRSDELHARVQAFAEELSLRPQAFEALALEIAQFQAEANPSYGRLIQASNTKLERYDEIAAVPVEAFRLSRVAVHAETLDRATFLTSGTTSGQRGRHVMRRTDTYRKVALKWGRAALLPEGVSGAKVLCLAVDPAVAATSSLGFMMQAFVEDFDEPEAARESDTWLLSDAGVRLEGLRRQVDAAHRDGRRVLLLATSFALLYLIDALAGGSLPLPAGSTVMQTGGFKGKTREIAPQEFRDLLSQSLGVDRNQIVTEYGMTELTSQLYEGTLPSGVLNAKPGWYLPPPWLRVDALSPDGFEVLAEGQPGLGCFTDLANVDSAVRILTQDRIRVVDGAVQLLGRDASAPARGCSLEVEELAL